MENLKKVTRAQWYLIALFIGFAFLMQNCQDDDALIYEENQTPAELSSKGPPVGNKVDVCRYNERKGTYSIVSLNTKFVPDRLQPSDVIIDEDGDGYAAYNECGVLNGDGIDLDDTNPDINPGAVEICGDGIDNNCNGETDEGCTYVPDDNFEQALIDLGYDTILDNYVLTSNINTRTSLNVNYYEGYSSGKIADLTGIEDFTALQNLACDYNQITSLDLSDNTALTLLSCNDNQLTSLNVSSNAALTYLYCNYNQLTSLDVSNNTSLVWFSCGVNQLESLDVSNNTALKYFGCAVNLLESLDVSKNTALESLYFNENKLTSINLSQNTSLRILHAHNNQLTSLDVSNNPNLSLFYCHYNKLISLDVSNNPNLADFYCYNNLLTSLGLSSNTNLAWLDCSENQLTSLDVGNNTVLEGLWIEDNQLESLDVSQNTVLEYLECFNNEALGCIQVNMSQLATAPTDPNWIKDGSAVYSTDCSSN